MVGLVRLGLDVGSECLTKHLNLNESSHYGLCTYVSVRIPNSPVFYQRPIAKEELNCQRDHLLGSIVIVNTYVVMDNHRDCLDSN
jgi:hypothetical protein